MATYNPVTATGECIFCAIAKGTSPAATYWEDNDHMAFLSITPNTPGYTVLITKRHFLSDVFQLPHGVLCGLMGAARKVASILKENYPGVGRVGLVAEGVGIDHAHVKLSPMHGTGFMKRGDWTQILASHEEWSSRYQGWISSAGGPRANDEELAVLADRLGRLARQH